MTVCKKDYGWRVGASPEHVEETWQVKSLGQPHSCGKQGGVNKRVTSRWLTHKCLPRLKLKMNWDSEAFIDDVSKVYNVKMSKQQVYRAKNGL